MKELLGSIDIVEYISQFVDLEEKNGEWWGLSCFKPEKTPSFSVRKDPPLFYDYSSGEGGNVFNFVKRYFNCSGRQAATILKEYAGVDDVTFVTKQKLSTVADCKRYAPKKATQKQLKVSALPSDYMDRYERRLDKLAAWEQEGISFDSIDKFQVRYDNFSNRLVYPIRSIEGDIVNIGGRTLDPDWKDKGLRKYTYTQKWGTINTIYGLFENMDAILAVKEVILFEGCKSVLIADSWGVRNTAAILTSHLSQNQLKILAKLGCKVVFALDKDVKIKDDKNIQRLNRYVNIEYLWDRHGLLDEKDAPVDKGRDVFRQLYVDRIRLR